MAKVVATKPRTANGGTIAPAPKQAIGGARAVSALPGYAPVTGYGTRPSPASIQAKETKAAGVTQAAAPYAPAPWNTAEQLSDAGAEAKYNNALLNAGYKKQAYETEYGLDPGYNDYKANPYSRAALLEQTFQRANRAGTTSLGAAGQLYSGASQNAETYNREHNAQERNSLESAYRKALQGVTEEEAGALASREEEKAAAKWKGVEAASNAELESETAPAATKANPYAEQAGGVKVKVKNKKTGKSTVIGINGARKAR
jgi:hypothetical protein